MSDIKTISHQLADLLKKSNSDYIEARLEESQTSHISYRGKQLESISKTSAVGGNIRALVKGGWGFVSFNDLDELPGKVEMAVRQARFVGNEESRLAATEPAVEEVIAKIGKNPITIPLADKKQLFDEYNDIILNTPGIKTSQIYFADGYKKTIFLNSSGSHITQERTDVALRPVAIATRSGDVQQVGISIGGRDDFSPIEGLHSQIAEMARQAVELLSAPRIQGGEHTVVLDPILAGVFIHEAFGHLSEADHVYENDRLRKIMTLGKMFGSPILNVVDTATLPGLRGSYKYDDEGTPAVKTYLIKEGELVGRLHSRETAARMNENPTGNARAINYRFPPIVRMTNTYIESGETSFDDMLADIKEGIYVKNWYGGQTSMEMFTFSAGETYMIRNGKIAETLRPVALTGNVFDTMKNIDAICNDLGMNQGGGCGKGGQSPLPCSNGSPHIRIHNCLVGGK